ncbi:receptor-like protein 6 [Vitis riparia]|uniref:receptor-like protein 6 n=1 Tax=Vitis riparia TaxID=96939 RepID=UPI00155A1B1B|nr:receptor-like protein 6 [Vitis riparia]
MYLWNIPFSKIACFARSQRRWVTAWGISRTEKLEAPSSLAMDAVIKTQIDSRVYANDFMYPILLKDVFDECFGICSGIDPCSSGKTGALLRYLQGPIDSSLVKLRSLSVIHLNYNNFTAPAPTLQILDLSNNQLLWGALPEFPQGGSLRTLVLSDTKFSGHMPDSIGKLEMLSWIELARRNFSGPIPSSIANLTRLLYLDLSSNGFTGSIPSFRSSKNLTHINLSRNYFTGQIISHHWEVLLNLVNLDLHHNLLHGGLPLSLFSHPSLQNIWLSNNQFSGQLNEFSAASYVLEALDLGSNNLQGPIPMSVFDLRGLHILELSFNKLNGILELSKFQKLEKLTTLCLSHNRLSINVDGFNSTFSKSPHFTTLKLASCNLRRFPDLRNHSKFLTYSDLSQNQIQGEIHNWIWMISNSFLMHLNLSHNLLVDLQQPFSNLPSYLSTLDLHSNLLHGRIPTPPQFSSYVDYSNNSFFSSIPDDIGTYMSFTVFFSVSKNNISGIIPASICRATYLQVLDLSNNALSGGTPSCLIENEALAVLNLRRNMFSSILSGNFPGNCNLQTLDLNGNLLEGTIPESVANCKELEVLNLGNNRIDDNFPCW